MASVTSPFIEEVTAHAQSDSLEDAREIGADGTYFPNNLRTYNELCIWNTTTRSSDFEIRTFCAINFITNCYPAKYAKCLSVDTGFAALL